MPRNRRSKTISILMLALATIGQIAVAAPPTTRPLFRDLMGLNTHTVQFKPALYSPVCRLLRDYHPIDWDLGGDTSHVTTFPLAANKVDWAELYGSWTKAGFEIDACLMFDGVTAQKWKDPARDARAYGEAFAKYFGPSSGHGLVSSIEVGNEPAKYTDAQYRTAFENMARGVRAGDPKMKVVTCAVMTGKTDQWSKPLSAVAGLEDLYDVLNIHSYAFKDKWPTWRRSYPEDLSIPYLKCIEDLKKWRDDHAPGKEVWLTEFGYDSASKPPPTTGEWKQWVQVTDEQQARYIVRSYLMLSSMGIERAYLYFFDDKDEPKLHAASGITRNFNPKPSFYAMAHLYKSLGDYRFVKAVVRTEGELYCFEFENRAEPKERVFVAWLPNDSPTPVRKVLPVSASSVDRCERMANTAAGPEKTEWKSVDSGVEVEVSGAPVFLWMR